MPKLEDELAWVKKGLKSSKPEKSSAPQEESSRRPKSPPPTYQTAAPARIPKESSKALPKESSKALVRSGFRSEGDERPGKASSSRRDEDRGREPKDDDRHGKSRHRGYRSDNDGRDRASGKELVRRPKTSKDKHRNDGPDPESDDDDRDRGKGKKVVRRPKPSKKKHRNDRSELESDAGSDSEPKGKKKSRDRERETKALVKHKRSNKYKNSDSDSDSDGIIEEVRKRFEDISFHELKESFILVLEYIFGVQMAKIEAWCDDGLIQMDTVDGSYSIRNLLKKGFMDEKEKEEWAKFEKKYRKWLAENPGGEMVNIPRFHKHLKGNSRAHGLSNAGPSRGPNIVVVQNPRPVIQVMQPPPQPPPMATARQRIPWWYGGCAQCMSNRLYCGDPYHRGIWCR